MSKRGKARADLEDFAPLTRLGAFMERSFGVASAITTGFVEVGCEGSLHVVALSSGAEVAVDADRLVVMASVLKPLVALEFYAQAYAGEIDPPPQ